jgi:hypothetical protein
MADPHGIGKQPAPLQRYDEELDFKSIFRFGVILTAVTLVVLALMWGMGIVFKEAEESKDRPPSPMAEALMDPIPPGPRLQSAPPRDMDELRAQDKDTLATYGWVDQAGGVARIPIDRAMSLVLEKGVGSTSDKKKEAK